MDALSIETFEQRAAEAEARLAALEAVIGRADSTAPRQTAIPETAALAELKQLLLKAREATVALQAERDKALEEADKLRYQVMHLKRAVQEADAKLGAA